MTEDAVGSRISWRSDDRKYGYTEGGTVADEASNIEQATLPQKMATDAERKRDLLAQPFPAEVTGKLPTYSGGKKTGDVDFVAWHHYSRRLNEVFPLRWSVSISHIDIVGDYLLMVVDVKVDSASYCGTGQAKADKANWGGAHAEAYSQAFRRACAQPGLGLYFYGKEEMDALRKSIIEETMDDTEATANMAEAPQGVEPDESPTETQQERLKEYAASGVFSDEELTEYRARIKAHFTKAGVGLVIREMKEKIEQSS
jgi:hypothetical protein